MPVVEMIPVSSIHVLNPRVRNRHQHLTIIENIGRIGLKRPITVARRRRSDGSVQYDLVCGQGRLEAYQALGYADIPALVSDAKDEDCLVRSLVENIARRQRPGIELMKEVGALHERGYSYGEIADKIGVTSTWVGMIVALLERGEDRLVAAVESGLLPLSLATDIAKSDDAAIQIALADAYDQGKLKGRKLTLVRRLLERRARRGKGSRPAPGAPKKVARKVTAQQLMRVFQREVNKQQVLVKKADFAQSQLMFVIEALRELMADASFRQVLVAHGLGTMPRALSDRMGGSPS